MGEDKINQQYFINFCTRFFGNCLQGLGVNDPSMLLAHYQLNDIKKSLQAEGTAPKSTRGKSDVKKSSKTGKKKAKKSGEKKKKGKKMWRSGNSTSVGNENNVCLRMRDSVKLEPIGK